jgi:integrase
MRAKGNGADRRSKIHALAVRGATAGERGAAQAALDRTKAVTPGKKRLTADACRTLNAPGIYWHDEIPGFALRIAKGGTRTFVLRYRGEDRCEHQITIGRLGADWTFGAARDHAKELRRKIAGGRDLATERRDRRYAPTVGDLIKRYQKEHLPTLAANTHGDQKTMLDLIGKHLGKHTKLADVDTEKVREMHRAIGESIGRNGVPRESRANRILTVCSKMFSLALQQRAGELPWRDPRMGNPCKGIKKYHEENRDRFFSAAELTAISAALDSYPGVAADVVRMCMFTGCRPREALLAKWPEFSQPSFWLKPASQTKQRKPHKIPLSPDAIAIIDKRRDRRTKADGGFVFPSADKPGKPLATLHHVWTHVRKLTGIGKARAYDLRHSFASVGIAEGLGLPVVGKLMGHSSPRTTSRYVHLDSATLREATEAIGNAIGRKNGGTEAQP